MPEFLSAQTVKLLFVVPYERYKAVKKLETGDIDAVPQAEPAACRGIKMTHEQLSERWEQFGNCEYDKALYVEYIIFCNLSSDEIFNNYLKAEEISEKAFFEVLDFLHRNQCYILLYKFMRDNKSRFVKPDFDRIKDIDFKDGVEKRMQRWYY